MAKVRKSLLEAADACREIQSSYTQQARKARKKEIKDLLQGCAVGAGACAVELEARAGLSLSQMMGRAAIQQTTRASSSTGSDSK